MTLIHGLALEYSLRFQYSNICTLLIGSNLGTCGNFEFLIRRAPLNGESDDDL